MATCMKHLYKPLQQKYNPESIYKTNHKPVPKLNEQQPLPCL